MKTRQGFVSNSSSSSFIIHNHSGRRIIEREFIKELVETYPDLIKRFEYYDDNDKLIPIKDRANKFWKSYDNKEFEFFKELIKNFKDNSSFFNDYKFNEIYLDKGKNSRTWYYNQEEYYEQTLSNSLKDKLNYGEITLKTKNFEVEYDNEQ